MTSTGATRLGVRPIGDRATPARSPQRHTTQFQSVSLMAFCRITIGIQGGDVKELESEFIGELEERADLIGGDRLSEPWGYHFSGRNQH